MYMYCISEIHVHSQSKDIQCICIIYILLENTPWLIHLDVNGQFVSPWYCGKLHLLHKVCILQEIFLWYFTSITYLKIDQENTTYTADKTKTLLFFSCAILVSLWRKTRYEFNVSFHKALAERDSGSLIIMKTLIKSQT